MSLSLRLMRWVVHRAARRLPEPERAEAEAEWLQHLGDLPTRRHKLRHVAGLWMSSGHVEPKPRRLDLDVTNAGTVFLLVGTSIQVVSDIMGGAPPAVIFPELAFSIPGAVIALVAGLRLRRKGKFHTME